MAKKKHSLDSPFKKTTKKADTSTLPESLPQAGSMTARPQNRAERLAGRGSYDLSIALKEAISQKSIELGIPASQLAHLLLLHAWRDLNAGNINIEPLIIPSESPRFRNNLDLDKLE